MTSGEVNLDPGALRALAAAHDRSAAVLGACARMVEQRTPGAVDGLSGYGPIARALAGWAESTAVIAAELNAVVDRVTEVDDATAAALGDAAAAAALGDAL
ncbi:hypothetical protein OG921_12135 [Aldersonia sp. NBC_00410]|uniref:hypothetical protein n=1 Tax=Aldersonia sp. NBC_00410 TaxID=2975954 RepID=UPI0022552AED|nr:hypothetical protein [Aldersonia sp. NBC_00410]MCX5043916.1 hypothetical protein [Aldersonia sp. NBC_00410]